MTKVAIFVDLSFFLKRYRALCVRDENALEAREVAQKVQSTALAHLEAGQDILHRIFVYDCRPLAKKVHNPITGRSLDFSRTSMFAFRTHLLDELTALRKVALRLGEIADRRRWNIRSAATRKLLAGSMRLDELTEDDVAYDIEQKGVDIRMALDIAALAYKRMVDRVVLVTGDSDFVPVAKLARREGIDVVLDPLWGPVAASMSKHIDGLRNAWPNPQGGITSLSA